MSAQSSTDLFKLFDQLNGQTYNINPLYIDLTGSVNAGYLLTQLIFLARAFKYKPFYRTDAQLREAYKLGSKELINARKRLVSLGLVSTQFKGVPPKWYYTINIDRITQLAIESSDFLGENPTEATEDVNIAETATLTSPKRRQQYRRNGEDINNKLNNDLKNNKEDICLVSKNITDIFQHWQATLNHPKAKLDKKRKRLLEDALKLYSVDDLKQAITGCASSEWHMGKNDRGQIYDGIDLIFRDAGKIEGFMRMAVVKPKPTPTKADYHQNVNNAFANVMRELSCNDGEMLCGAI